MDPNNAVAYNNRGLVKYASGQKESGYIDLLKALKLGYKDANAAIKQLYNK